MSRQGEFWIRMHSSLASLLPYFRHKETKAQDIKASIPQDFCRSPAGGTFWKKTQWGKQREKCDGSKRKQGVVVVRILWGRKVFGSSTLLLIRASTSIDSSLGLILANLGNTSHVNLGPELTSLEQYFCWVAPRAATTPSGAGVIRGIFRVDLPKIQFISPPTWNYFWRDAKELCLIHSSRPFSTQYRAF